MPKFNRRESKLFKAYLSKLSERDREDLLAALSDFDGDYQKLMSHVRRLGGSDQDYTAVNRGARREMGYGRGNVDPTDFEQVSTWAEGYRQTKIQMDNLSDPERDARTGFDLAKRLWGLLSWD